MKLTIAASLGAVLFLAACSGPSEPETTTAPAVTAPAKTAESKLPETGGKAPIELSAIGKGELLALEGERGCSFTIDGQAAPALVAKAGAGADATTQGAVKVGARVQRVAGSGDFAALEKGMMLSGPGLKLEIERASGSAAKLVAHRTYGGERSFDGVWKCDA